LDATNLGWNLTQVPPNLTNVTAISAGPMHTLALKSDGTVIGWGYSPDGETNVPSGLSNVVAIAAGGGHSLALKSDGTVIAWGLNDYGQTNIPMGLSNVMAIAAGDNHSVALKNDGTLVEWGDDSSSQATVPLNQATTNITGAPSFATNITPASIVKLIAAGGDHTLAATWSPFLQYPVDVTRDLLLIYNTNSIDSWNVCQYYLSHRPMVGACTNVLGVGCATNEGTSLADYSNNFCLPLINWLSNNPTKRPEYVVLFQELPERITNSPSVIGPATFAVQADLNLNFDFSIPSGVVGLLWYPLPTSINMDGAGGTNDCIAYVNKLTNMAGANQTLYISASAAGYGSTNWSFDVDGYDGTNAAFAVLSQNPFAVIYSATAPAFTTMATNVAGYYTCGYDCSSPAGSWTNFATNGTIKFFGNSGWFIMSADDSFNGQRTPFYNPYQWSYLSWFASDAFGGANYSNSAIGAVGHVDEPLSPNQESRYVYFGDWADEKPFGITAWDALYNNGAGHTECAVVGDPFVKR
jgi:hypothetical protein